MPPPRLPTPKSPHRHPRPHRLPLPFNLLFGVLASAALLLSLAQILHIPHPSPPPAHPRPRPRPRPAPSPHAGKVFGVGTFKTGTTSLAHALRTLGFHDAPYGNCTAADGADYPCTTTTFVEVPGIHDAYPKVHDNVRRSEHWPALLRAAHRATALADGPWFFMFREWDAIFPGSKFVLTLREGGGRAVAVSDLKMWERMGLESEKRARYPREEILDMIQRRYDEHVDAVRSYFADRPDDILEICFQENSDAANWRMLTDFLLGANVAIPDQPFPNLNTQATGFQ